MRLLFLTTHMFACYKSHSLIFGRVSWKVHRCYTVFGHKYRLYVHRSSARHSYSLSHTYFLAINLFLWFFVEAITLWKSISASFRYWWKWSFMVVISQKHSLYAHLSLVRDFYYLPHICFLIINQFLRYLMETICF